MGSKFADASTDLFRILAVGYGINAFCSGATGRAATARSGA